MFLYFNKAKYFLLHVISRYLTISAAMLLLLFVISLLFVLPSVSLCIVCRVCRSDNQFNVCQDFCRVITVKLNLILYPVFKLVCGIWPSAVDKVDEVRIFQIRLSCILLLQFGHISARASRFFIFINHFIPKSAVGIRLDFCFALG